MEALDVPEDSKHSNKDKQMSMGRKKFNMDPKKGKFITIYWLIYLLVNITKNNRSMTERDRNKVK